MTQRAQGTASHVASVLPKAGEFLAKELTRLVFVISEKSAATCDDTSLSRDLNRRFGRKGLSLLVSSQVRDLGVANTAGRVRRVSLLKERLAKAGKRTKRVRTLIGINGRATKLFKTGVRPQAMWGSPMGISPAMMTKFRSQASVCSGIKAKGKCATTAIFLGLGEDADPKLHYPCMVVKGWIELWGSTSPTERAELSRVWIKLVRNIRSGQGKARWKRVKGLASALVATLLDLGWM